MEIIDFETFVKRIPTLINEKNVTVLGQSNKPCVLYGADEFNIIEGVDYYHTHNFGGVIVNFEGDISIANYSNKTMSFGKEFLIELSNYLKTKGLNCELVGNDLLANGMYKVASYMSQRFGDVIFTGIHISINMDLETINQICTKQMVKTPKGLSEFGITTQDILEFINNVL